MTDEQNPDPMHSQIPSTDPFALFDAWFAEAGASEPNDSNAMALATATPDGAPSVRMVLLKGHGPELGAGGGFTFYTNVQSRKGEEIRANCQASLLFHWKSLRRQIRIEGPLAEVAPEVADEYFRSRSRDSQLGAAASDQSRPMDDRATFLKRFAEAKARFAGGEVERPAHWTGFTLTPLAFEFWLDRPGRLHDRRRFERRDPGFEGGWTDSLLYP